MSEVKKYLDQSGVDAFWLRVKKHVSDSIADKSDAGHKHEIADVNGLQDALDLKADKATTYTKTETDAAIKAKVEALGSVLNFKGVKATKAELPSTGNKTGDVWHVTADSGEYVWDGKAWEELGSTVSLDGYLTEEAADSKYAKPADITLTGVQVNGTDLAITGKKVNVTVETGTANGNIKVNGTDVPVKGLGSAAYKDETAFATKAQGEKADTALQEADLADYLKTTDADTKYATAEQGTKADTALQPADIEAIPVEYINGLAD